MFDYLSIKTEGLVERLILSPKFDKRRCQYLCTVGVSFGRMIITLCVFLDIST